MTDTKLDPDRLAKLDVRTLRTIATTLRVEDVAKLDKAGISAAVAAALDELEDRLATFEGIPPATFSHVPASKDGLPAHVRGDFEPPEIRVDRLTTAPEIRLEDVRWRIDSDPVNVKGDRGRARYISYVDARVVGDYLDEWVGPDRWEVEYEEANLLGNPVLWCHLSIHFPDRTVVRSDLSTYKPGRGRSDGDKVATGMKGVVSDAFKRAAVQAGIGRNVYELPEVWASCVVRRRGDKMTAYPSDESTREILATLRRAGYETDVAPTVDAGTETGEPDETETAETETAETEAPNWTAWARKEIFFNLDRDRDRAAAAYRVALDTLGIEPRDDVDGHADPDEIPDEETARKVVAAATTTAIAENLPDDVGHDPGDPAPWDPPNGEVETRILSEAVAHKANEIVETKTAALRGWVEFGDASFRWSREARRATIVATKGDLAAATDIYSGILDANSWDDPLDRDDAVAYLGVLESELGASA